MKKTRIECKEPNIQNIPIRTKEGREIQRAFSRPNDDIAKIDFGTSELRVLSKLWRAMYGVEHG